jgi:signal transduction histidine kinase
MPTVDLALSPQEGSGSSQARGKLLIIDDEEEILKSLRRQFRREYDVHIAANAEEGHRIIREVPIQVVISDQRMPGVTGVQFLSQIKEELPDATFLLLTGYADIQAVIAAINEGDIYRYITKPWDPAEMQTTVREAFERYELITENRRLLTELQGVNTRLEQRVEERTAELGEANARLIALNAQKNQFMGMAAHDLRSPLSVILGYTDLLLTMEEITPEERRRLLATVDKSAQGMLNLLDDLLDITVIESGRVDLHLTPVDLYQYIAEVSDFNRVIGERKGIHLVADLEPGLPRVTFDPGRIQQVMNNLIGNAFKFSHSGTTVTVQVRQNHDRVEIAVIDQGQGIKPGEVGNVFSEFTRASTRATAGERGTGLGLSICKRLVELHGGHIGAESETGRGSRFYFQLPLTISS